MKNDHTINHRLHHHPFIRCTHLNTHSSDDGRRRVGPCLLSIRPILCRTDHRHTGVSLASVTLHHHHENYLGITMNPVIHDIALATGGSFYPAVGGNLLEQSVLMAVRQCITIALDNRDPLTAQDIAQHFGIEQTQ